MIKSKVFSNSNPQPHTSGSPPKRQGVGYLQDRL